MSFTQKNITKLALFSFLAIGFSLAAVAQEADSAEEVVSEETVADSDESAEDEVELTKISVTGSRIKRSEVEGPQPLVVITKEQIEQGGFISVYDAVSSVSQNTGDFQGAIASGGFTPGAETINLRDFGPGNTLVLVNGKRRADYPFPYGGNDSVFNWNSIPISLVERIEILSSGASAIYGSDAVAGVVNVILIDGLEETSVRVRGGTHLDGGGDNYNFEISGGGYTDRLSYAWGLEHSQQDPIQGINRKEYNSYKDDKDPRYRDPSWSLIYIDLFGGPNRLPSSFGNESCENIGGYLTVTDGAFGPGGGYPFCGFDDIKYKSVRNDRESDSAYITATYKITDNLEFYADAFQWKQSSEGVYQPRFYFDYFYGYAMGNNDAGPREVVGSVVQRIWTDYFWNRAWEDETNSYTAGFRGNFDVGNNIWDWELTYTEDDYELSETSDFVSVEGIQDWMCGNVANTAFAGACSYGYFGLGGYFGIFNPDQWFEPTATSADNLLATAGVYASEFGTSGSESTQFQLTGDLFDLPAGPVGFALVVEEHTQKYFNDATENAKNDEVQYLSPAVGGGERDRDSWGIEFSIPVTSTLQVGFATRNDDYDEISTNIGSRGTDSWNFAWRPTQKLLVRGSWGESFKAPSLPYVYKGLTTGFSSPCDYWGLYLNTGNINGNCAGYNQINTPILSKGNLDLVEEEGENYSFGIVYDIISSSGFNWDMSLDLFEIELENVTSNTSFTGILFDEGICRIQASGGDTGGIQYSDAYCANVISKVTRGADYTPSNGSNPEIDPPEGGIASVQVEPLNKGYLYYRGADFTTSMRILTDNIGDFGISLSTSYVDDEKRADEAGEEPYSLWDGGYTYRLRTKSYLGTSWRYGNWSTGVNVERWGHMEGSDGKKSPYFETSIYAQYRFDPAGKHYLQVNVNNALNAIPDKDANLAWPYFQDLLYPAVGRELIVTYRYTF